MLSGLFGPAGIHFGLAVFIILFEVCRPRRVPFDFLFMFNISYLVYFAVAPMHILLGGAEYVPASMLAVHDDYLGARHHWNEFALAMMVVAGYALVLVGYYSRIARQAGLRVNIAFPSRNSLYFIAWLFGTIGVVALLIYGRQFDGVVDVILKGALIRGGIETSDSSVLFLMHFIQFANCASILLFAVLIGKQPGESRAGLRLLFVLSVGLVILAILTVGARRSLVLYSASLYFIYANMTGRRRLDVLAMLAAAFLMLLMFGDQALIGLSAGTADVVERVSSLATSGAAFLYQAVWRDLTLPYVEFAGIVMRFDGWPRLFMDVPLGILEAVPERLVPLELPALLVEESTELLSGQKLGDIVAIPTGFLGFGWYSGLLPGVILGSLLFGYIGGFFESALRIVPGAAPAAVTLYVLAGFTWAYSIRIGIPGMVLNERFHWFALVFVLLVLSRITVSRERPAIAAWRRDTGRDFG